MYKETKVIPRFLALWFEYYNRTYVLPEILVNILLVQASLINLSYIYQDNPTSWIYILTLLARPQLIINIPNLEYIGIIYLVLWVLYLFKQHIFGSNFIKLINTLLKGGLFNFVLEQFKDILGLVVSILICLILLIDQIIMQGTLSIQTINFQTTYPSNFFIINAILNIIIIFGNKFNYSINAVKIVAIVSSSIKILSIFQYNNYRCKQIRVFILFIHLATVYFGIIDLLNNYEHSYTLILLPLFWRVSASLQFKPFGEKDPIIEASVFLKEGKLFDSFLALNSIKNESLIRNIKLNFLIQECVEEINRKINSQSHLTQNLKGVAQLLVENDIKNASLSNQINEIIEKKLQLLYNIKTASVSQINSYIQKVKNVKVKLDQYYQTQSSSSVQALTVFFYSEIINDYIIAKQLQNQVITTLETQIRINDTALSKLIYLVANYENKKITVTGISSNAPKAFCNKNLDELIPAGVREWHTALVDRFFHNGYSKYVRNLNQNYIAYGKFIETVLFAIDIVYTNQVDLICLLQPTIIDNKTIIVNENYEISSMSQDFSNFSNLSKYFGFGEKIDKFIPQIVNIRESCYVEDIIVIPSQHIASVTNLDQQKTEMNYYCDINVVVQNLEGKMIYMIIQFDNFKKQLTVKTEQIQQQSQKSQEYENSEIIPIEIEADEITEPYQFSQYSQLSSSEVQEKPDNNKKQIQSCLRIRDGKSTKKVNIFSPREDDEEVLVKFNRNSLKVNSQFKKTQFKEEIEDQFNENQSQVSSIKAFRNSKFYRKYELYNKFLSHIPHKSLHKTITGLILLLFLYQIIFILIQLTGLSLMAFSDDINLLEIKNLLFQPMEVFLVTRWTLFNYKNALNEGKMTLADYNYKSVFAKSNLQLGYDQLNTNIQSVLFLQDLQTLLQQQYIYAFQYLDTYKNERYNITLRAAIQVLLNFQYTLKMNYVIDGTVNTDSPQVFYSYKNYRLLNDVADQLSEDISQQTLLRGQNMQNQIITIFVVQQSLLIFNFLCIVLAKYIINKRLKMCINLYSFVEEEEILNEIAQQTELLKQIKNDNSYKFSYNLDIELKEQQFLAKINDSVTAKQKRSINYGISLFGFIILLFFLYLFLTINQFIIFLSQNNFLEKYPQTTSLMRMFADLGVDIPRMFARREILYGRKRIVYLGQEEFTYDLKQINISLENTIQFTSMDIDFANLLFTDSFKQYYDEIQKNDLCGFIPNDLKNKTQTLCPIIFNSNMKLGLKTLLIYLQNIIATDIVINNFVSRNATTPYELDGVFILSQIIKAMNEVIFADMLSLTKGIVYYMKIINISFLSLILLLLIFGIKIMHEKLIYSTQQITNFAYLIPSQTLFSNDIFERVVRSLIIKN